MPVLTDFGISRVHVESCTIAGTQKLRGSIRYMAPELLSHNESELSTHHLHTKASDIWAFGMCAHVCLNFYLLTIILTVFSKEILSGFVPYHTVSTDGAVMRKLVNRKLPKQLTTMAGPDIITRWLMEKTWLLDPSERPNAKIVVQTLVFDLNSVLCASYKMFT